MKKKVLVLVQDYPDNNGGLSLMFVHTRNQYYVLHGIDVTVLSFSAHADYEKDGINVICENSYNKSSKKYDLLILHAANIRNHYRFLKKNGHHFPHYMFFYHGHEIMRINREYSKPYPYMKRGLIRRLFQSIYDEIKILTWRFYIPKLASKADFVFVSNWLKSIFFKNLKLSVAELNNNIHVIHNVVGPAFESSHYDFNSEKCFDFITVRSTMDASNYCIDIVNRIAFNTPDCRFLLIGVGNYFDKYKKAPNIVWHNARLSHEQLVDAIGRARFALMPTRNDTQGLMSCEMIAMGIPLITSDIPVCHEFFDGFENVYFIDNDDENINLSEYLGKPTHTLKYTRCTADKTVMKEVELIKKR